MGATAAVGWPLPGAAEPALPILEPGATFHVGTSGVGWGGVEFAVPTNTTVTIQAHLPPAEAYGLADYTFVAFSVYYRDDHSELIGSRSFAQLGNDRLGPLEDAIALQAGQRFHVIVLSTVAGAAATVFNGSEAEPVELTAGLGPIPAGGVAVVGGSAPWGVAAGADTAGLVGRAASMYGWIDGWRTTRFAPHAHVIRAPCLVDDEPQLWGSSSAGTSPGAASWRHTSHTLEEVKIDCQILHAAAGVDHVHFAIYAIPLTLQPTR